MNVESLRVDDRTPARRFDLTDLAVGQSVEQVVVFDDEMWSRFDALAGDHAPIHRQAAAAAAIGFDRPIVQGLAITTRFSRLLGMYLPGERAVLQRLEVKFVKPVFVPATLAYSCRIVRILKPLRAVCLKLKVSQHDMVCVEGLCQCVLR